MPLFHTNFLDFIIISKIGRKAHFSAFKWLTLLSLMTPYIVAIVTKHHHICVKCLYLQWKPGNVLSAIRIVTK